MTLDIITKFLEFQASLLESKKKRKQKFYLFSSLSLSLTISILETPAKGNTNQAYL